MLITREQAIEMLIAIELEILGVAPRHALEAAKFYAEEISDQDRGPVHRDDRLIVTRMESVREGDPRLATLHLPDDDPKRLVFGHSDVVTSLQRVTPSLINRLLGGHTFAVVNIGRSVSLLDRALGHASAQAGIKSKRQNRSN